MFLQKINLCIPSQELLILFVLYVAKTATGHWWKAILWFPNKVVYLLNKTVFFLVYSGENLLDFTPMISHLEGFLLFHKTLETVYSLVFRFSHDVIMNIKQSKGFLLMIIMKCILHFVYFFYKTHDIMGCLEQFWSLRGKTFPITSTLGLWRQFPFANCQTIFRNNCHVMQMHIFDWYHLNRQWLYLRWLPSRKGQSSSRLLSGWISLVRCFAAVDSHPIRQFFLGFLNGIKNIGMSTFYSAY